MSPQAREKEKKLKKDYRDYLIEKHGQLFFESLNIFNEEWEKMKKAGLLERF